MQYINEIFIFTQGQANMMHTLFMFYKILKNYIYCVTNPKESLGLGAFSLSKALL